ncbi:MAG TPA: hypothetical protein VIQ30_16195 [Pseudonocardia sp.]
MTDLLPLLGLYAAGYALIGATFAAFVVRRVLRRAPVEDMRPLFESREEAAFLFVVLAALWPIAAAVAALVKASPRVALALKKPPRLPVWFVGRFPVAAGRPPRIRKPKWKIDFAFAAVGGALIGAAAVVGHPVLWILGGAFALYGVWLSLLNIVAEQQITDWANQPPNPADVPEVERPNG